MAETEPPPGRKLTRAEKAVVNRKTWATRASPPSSRVLTGTLTRAQMQALRQEAWRLRHVSATPLNLPPDFAMTALDDNDAVIAALDAFLSGDTGP
jgi:hypothetical protein